MTSRRTNRSSRKAGTEFSLIRDYFSGHPPFHSETRLGIGDDAALLELADDEQLVVSIDTMVEGVHFFPDVDPAALGHKLLAVNLSDLAAMGAEPRWATLALTLPESDPVWLQPFSQGLFDLARQHRVDLVGGDTTRGPLTLTLQIHGVVPKGEAVSRSGARPGDLIAVTGALGAAGHVLQRLLKGQEAEQIRHYLERPQPQLAAGLLLRGRATSMIDLSDGLLADLGHILQRSGVGGWLDLPTIPIHPALAELPQAEQLDLALTAGDDYQLCFTLPPAEWDEVHHGLSEIGVESGVVGKIEAGEGLRWEGGWHPGNRGYQHF